MTISSPWVPRLVLGGAAIGLLAAIISIAVGRGGPEKITITGGEQVQELIAGIAQDGAYLGPPDAAVTITVFNDLQCPSCAEYELETVDPLIEEYARTGRARLEFRNFSLGQTETTKSAYGATAAGEQDREWQYVELLFRNQGAAPENTVTDEFLQDVGNAIPDFDLDAWKEAVTSSEVKSRVESDAKLAIDLRLTAQPAIVVSGPNGTRQLEGKPSQADVEAAVAAVGGA
jgi:protein-disulfide isomerase